jgi:hypothetical protein
MPSERSAIPHDPEMLEKTVAVAQTLANRMRAVIGLDGVNILNASGPTAEESVMRSIFT